MPTKLGQPRFAGRTVEQGHPYSVQVNTGEVKSWKVRATLSRSRVDPCDRHRGEIRLDPLHLQIADRLSLHVFL